VDYCPQLYPSLKTIQAWKNPFSSAGTKYLVLGEVIDNAQKILFAFN